MKKKQLTIILKGIDYSGDNLGDDIRLNVTIDGNAITVKRKVKHGTTVSLKEVILEKQIRKSDVPIPIQIQVTEEDPLYNDIGSGSGSLPVIFDGAELQTYSFQVTVTGDSIGDKGENASFTLTFEAILKGIGIKYVKNVSKRGWLSIKHEDGLDTPNVLPYGLKVQVTEIKNGREYFIIEEGRLQGHHGSIKLTDDGISYLTETNVHTASVHLIYSKQNEILQIAGTNKEYWAVLDPHNPLPSGTYDIEIPYEPHPLGAYYERYSIYAKTWFRIGHSGDRYLHFGQISTGCVTVRKQVNNPAPWNEIYQLLITSRKGDSKSVGTIEIQD